MEGAPTLLGVYVAGQNPVDKTINVFCKEYELKSVGMFYKGTVKDTFKFIVRESLGTLDRGSRHKVVHEDYTVYVLIHPYSQLGAYAFVKGEYLPLRTIYSFLQKSLDAFKEKIGETWKNYSKDQELNVPELQVLLKQYQNPKNVDLVCSAQSKVDETSIILHENVKKLLERQGDLDVLVEKSKDLNLASKQLYKSSKGMKGGCCNLI